MMNNIYVIGGIRSMSGMDVSTWINLADDLETYLFRVRGKWSKEISMQFSSCLKANLTVISSVLALCT